MESPRSHPLRLQRGQTRMLQQQPHPPTDEASVGVALSSWDEVIGHLSFRSLPHPSFSCYPHH